MLLSLHFASASQQQFPVIFDDSRTVGGRCAFAEDIEIMTGSGECHIEQVQIIYNVLQMLVMVVIFIDASFHLFGTEIYRNQRQFVVRSFLRGTPDGIGFLQLPVAVWHDDMVEFQSLTLVDGDESDTLDAVTMDAFS